MTAEHSSGMRNWRNLHLAGKAVGPQNYKKTSVAKYYKIARVLFEQAKLGTAFSALEQARIESSTLEGLTREEERNVHLLRAELLVAMGTPLRAMREFELQSRQALPEGSTRERQLHLLSGAKIALAMDRFADASDYVKRVQAVKKIDDRQLAAELKLIEGQIFLHRGDLSKSYSALVDAHGQCKNYQLLSEIRLSLADVYLLAGDCTEAFAQLLHADRHALHAQLPRQTVRVALQRVMTLLQCGYRGEARIAINKLNDTLQNVDLPVEQARGRALMGLLAMDCGRPEESQSHFLASRRNTEKIDSKSVNVFTQFSEAIACDFAEAGECKKRKAAVQAELLAAWNHMQHSGNIAKALVWAMNILRANRRYLQDQSTRNLSERICTFLDVHLPNELRHWLDRIECGDAGNYATTLFRGPQDGPLACFTLPQLVDCNGPNTALQLRLMQSRIDNLTMRAELQQLRHQTSGLKPQLQGPDFGAAEYEHETAPATVNAPAPEPANHHPATHQPATQHPATQHPATQQSNSAGKNTSKYEENMQHPLAGRLSSIYPELTAAEISICIDIYNNRNTKDIANKYYLAVRTVEKHRYNIRRKMFLTRYEDLYNLLTGL